MKGFINIIDRDLRDLSVEDLMSLERDTIHGLSVKVDGKWKTTDSYIHFDNSLLISWIHITPREWKTAQFIEQKDGRLYFEWDNSVMQNYFSYLFRDMEKVIPNINKSGLYFNNDEISSLVNQLKNLLF
jgi:hypothetical protein